MKKFFTSSNSIKFLLLFFVVGFVYFPLSPVSKINSAHATPVNVQSKSVASQTGSSVTASFDSAVTAGSLLVIGIRNGGAADVTSVTDSLGQTWIQVGTKICSPLGYSVCGSLWYFPNTASGSPTITINLSTSTSVRAVLTETSGIATSSPLDQNTTGTAETASTFDVGPTGTLSQADELVVGFVVTANGYPSDITAGAGFTRRGIVETRIMLEDKIVSSTSAVNATGTFVTTADHYAGFVATFKAASSGTTTLGDGTDGSNSTIGPGASVSGYSYFRPLTIDKTKVPNTNQTDFPVMISGTYPFLKTVANGGKITNASGYDVVFYSDAALTTQLKHETERWVATTGEVVYWVKVPTVSTSVDTIIYMAYGNSSISTDQSDAVNVWDTNYKGVWHLPNGTTLSASDSTSNGNNGTINGATATAGLIDGGGSFVAGSSQYINNPAANTIGITNSSFTASAWIKGTSYSGDNSVFGTDEYGTNTGLHLIVRSSKAYMGFYSNDTGGNATLSAGTWYYIVWRFNSANGEQAIYVNGSLDNSTTGHANFQGTGNVKTGRWVGGYYFNGIIEEGRFSNTARSADWIATEYNNQNSPSTFYTVGSENSATEIDRFSLATSAGTDTVTGMTVTLGPAGAFNNLATVGVYTTADALKCESSSWGGDLTVELTSCGIPVTTSSTEYVVKITPKTHAAMDAVPGASYATTATVTDWTGTNTTHAGTDTDSATITVDNASPAGVTSSTATAGNTVVDLAWTNPADADFTTGGTVVVLRRASSAITQVPVEGTTYTVGNVIGGVDTVACVVTGSPPATTCQDTGLTNGTVYHYKIFSQDSRGNYDAGTVPTGSPATPAVAATTTLGDGTDGANSTIGPGTPISGYSYSRALTIDKTKVPNTNQTDFPVMISGTYPFLKTVANGGKITNASGYDVVFYSDAALTTQLKHETERWVATTGEVVYWVKVPTVSTSVDTVIYMAYGNSSISTDQSDAVNVWDTNYKGVWHLPDGTTLGALDSTSNNNDGTITGVTAVTGQIDGAGDFDAGTDKISVGDITTPTNLTLNAWIYPTGVSTADDWIIVNKNNSEYDFRIAGAAPPGYLKGNAGGTSITDSTFDFTSAGNRNQWYQVAYTFDSVNDVHKLYRNGSEVDSGANTASITDTVTNLWIGRHSQFDFGTFSGKIDEVRISAINRSADWITTEYNNQNSPSTFYSVGSENSATEIDRFSLVTSAGTDTVTGMTVTLAGDASAYTNIATVDVQTTAGALKCSATPSANAVALTTCGIAVTTTPTEYVVKITPKTHANMPAVPGASYATTATVTAITATNSTAGTDTDSATITVDNLSSGEVTGATATPGNAVVDLAWTNPTTALNEGLIGYWNLNEDPIQHSSTVADSSGQSNTGTASTNDGATNKAISGQISGAVDLDGTDDYITMGDDDIFNPSSALTISGWANIDTATGDKTIISKSEMLTGVDGEYFLRVDAQLVRFTIQTSAGSTGVFKGGTTLSTGTWYHVVGVWDGTNAYIYVNGASDATPAALSGTLGNSTSPFVIGAGRLLTTPTKLMNGKVDEVRIYNRALSAGEVAALYNLTVPDDYSQTIVLRRATSAVADVPVEGTSYSVGNTIGTATVACVTSSTSCQDTGLTNGTAYHFKIFTKDAQGNYSATGVVPTGSPATPFSATTTLGDGTDGGNSTIGPGAAATEIDRFSLVTSAGTDTVTGMTVTLAPSGAFNNLATVGVYTTGDVLKCSLSSWGGDLTVELTSCAIAVTTTPTDYVVKVTPKTHAAMPAVPGASYATTATVTAITATNTTAGTDTDSATITVDNASPAGVTSSTATAGYTIVDLAWTNPVDSDFTTGGTVVVLRRTTSVVTDVPVEGTTYTVGNIINTVNTVACVVTGSPPATTCQDTGLSNGTAYYYKIFTQDSRGNYNAGTVPTGSPATPVEGVTVSGTVYEDSSVAPWGGCDGSTTNIALSVAGGAKTNVACNASTGAFSFSNMIVTANNIATMFLDTGGGDKGALYTRALDDVTNITGLSLTKNVITLRYETGSSITNSNINTYDQSNDADIPVASDGTNITLDGGVELLVDASKTFAPGGNVTADVLHVKGTYTGSTETLTVNRGLAIDSGGTFTAPATLNLSGNLTNNGTFTHNSGAASVTPGFSGYQYSSAITIDATQVPGTSNLTNFPVLFSGTYDGTGGEPDLRGPSVPGKVTSANGYDIIFTSDAVGTKKLDFEIERYTTSTGEIIAWVQIPTLDYDDNTTIYMHYGNSGITTDQSNATGVWDSNYKGVWHLPNGTTLGALDSTSNNNDGTITGVTAVTGQIDGAASFDGVDDYVDAGTFAVVSTGFTMSAWVKYNAFSSPDIWERIIQKADGTSEISHDWMLSLVDSGGRKLRLRLNRTATTLFGNTTLATGNWYHVAATFNNGVGTIYLNGVADGSSSAFNSGSLPNNANPVYIGQNTNLNASPNGLIDEVRIYNRALSADWITTEYNNQSVPSSFYTVGSEAASGATTTIAGANNITFNSFTVSAANGAGGFLKFKAGGTYTFSGAFSAAGENGNILAISSDSTGNQWTTTFSSTAVVDNITVKDSGCSGGNNVSITSTSTSLGNNGSCWFFVSRGGGGGGVEASATPDPQVEGGGVGGGAGEEGSAPPDPETGGGGASGGGGDSGALPSSRLLASTAEIESDSGWGGLWKLIFAWLW